MPNTERSTTSEQSQRSDSRSSIRQSRVIPMKSVPDMRFEQSFLASIRGFIHEEEPEEARKKKIKENENQFDENEKDVEDDEPSKIMTSKSSRGEPELWLGRLRIEWFPLLYITVRDQFFSPIIQGAIFGIAGMAFGQVRNFLIANQNRKSQRSLRRN